MKSSIKSVSVIHYYGSMYYIVRYWKGMEKHIWQVAYIPQTVYKFMENAPYLITYHDRENDWSEKRYSSTPVQYS